MLSKKHFPLNLLPFFSSMIPVAKPQGTISARLTLKCNYHGNKLWLTAGLSYSQWTCYRLRVVLEVHSRPSGTAVSSAELRAQKLWTAFIQHQPSTSCVKRTAKFFSLFSIQLLIHKITGSMWSMSLLINWMSLWNLNSSQKLNLTDPKLFFWIQ